MTARRGGFTAQLLAVAAVCALVFWLGLGVGGFTSTEGHRVLPAYEMLDAEGGVAGEGWGGWLVPSLFGQPYLRKPPGAPWAIALASELFGRTEFAARAVSALSMTLLALLSAALAGRWFGRRTLAPLAAGLAVALMPWLWSSGRQAEIEAMHNLAVAAAALLLLDVLILRPRPGARSLGAAGAGLAVAAAVLAKGPAGLPVLVAAVASACIVRRSVRPCVDPFLWLALTLAAAVLTPVGLAIAARLGDIRAAGGSIVLQSPAAFAFEPGRLVGIALLLPAAFVSAFPAALAALFPWGPDARREAEERRPAAGSDTPLRLAQAAVLTFLIACGLYTLAGIGNPRYALPAAVVLPVVWGYVAAGFSAPGRMTPKRRAIARLMLLCPRPARLPGPLRPLAAPWLPIVLLAGAVFVYIPVVEGADRAASGRTAGIALAEALRSAFPDAGGPLVLAADDLVEARPEVLHYARTAGAEQGLGLVPRWFAGVDADGLLARGDVALLRDDPGSNEWAAVAERVPEEAVLARVDVAGRWSFVVVNTRRVPGRDE